jgi:hypothetical protein
LTSAAMGVPSVLRRVPSDGRRREGQWR